MKELKNTEIPWNQLSPQLQDKYLSRAEYLINRGYHQNKNMYKLAELIYNSSMINIKPEGWVGPSHKDNHGLLNKI